MRSFFVMGSVLVVCCCLYLEPVLASDDVSTSLDAAEVNDQAQEEPCPPAELVCSLYTGGLCAVGAHFTGREALEKNFLAEADVKPKNDNSLFPTSWEVKHRGELLAWGGPQCVLTPQNAHKTLLEIPPEAHCAAILVTNEHQYIWFFASNPNSGCVGYGECVCY